jgi:Rrf2 family iron-sulfur cluster assembly transcriptional regulator
MILSKTCNYGLRAVLYVTVYGERPYVPIREISEELNISFHFLTKILQTLTQSSIMISFKGPNGGVALARPAESIQLAEIVEAIDGVALFDECLLGLEHCGTAHPCPVHAQWADIRERIGSFFRATTVADLAATIKQNGFRLTDLAAIKRAIISTEKA